MTAASPLAELLGGYLHKSGVTPGKLSRLSGVPKPTIVNWLDGRVQRPHTWHGLIRIALALDLSATETSTLLVGGGFPPLHHLVRRTLTPRDDRLLAAWDGEETEDTGEIDDMPPASSPAAANANHRLVLPLSSSIPGFGTLATISAVPLARNPLFVGRAADLRAMAVELSSDDVIPTVALTGIGGIGKTQLAAEFVHRYGQFFPGGVFWLSFADAAAVPNDIAGCGGVGHLALRPDFGLLPLADQVELVLAAWRNPLPRLLVFDNCEDEDLLERWRPTTGGCRVLVTSQRSVWDATLGVRTLPLHVLERSTSVTLLRQHVPEVPPDSPDLDAIAAELGDLPLALHLAGSYLARYRHAISPEAYLLQLRRDNLLHHTSLHGGSRSPTRHAQDVGRTFALSLGRLNPTDLADGLAWSLLTHAACFAPGAAIPRDLLFESCRRDATAGFAQVTATDAITRLRVLGVVETGPDGTVRLHRLIAAYVQTEMDEAAAQSDVEHTLITMAERLNSADDIVAMHELYRHLVWVADAAFDRTDLLAAQLCRALGHYLWRANRWQEARHYFERAVAICELNPSCHPVLLAETLQSLGLVLQVQGLLTEAHELFVRALALLEECCGPEHVTTSHALTNLGFVLILAGDYDRSRPLLKRALAVRRAAGGLEDAETGHILHSLGLLELRRGMERRARRYLKLALAVRQAALPPEHIAIAQTLYFLGEASEMGGDLSNAWAYHERAFHMRTSLLGEENAAPAESMYGLSRILYRRGDLHDARVLLERAVGILIARIGADNPLTLTVQNTLCALMSEQAAGSASTSP